VRCRGWTWGSHGRQSRLESTLGADEDLFISAVYAPVHAAQIVAAFEEVMASYQTFRVNGLVAIGGDLIASNGNVIVSADGKRLLDMCRKAGLTVVNSMVDIYQGDFTRVQDACVNGVNIRSSPRETTFWSRWSRRIRQ
jgi:hypothetical protein